MTNSELQKNRFIAALIDFLVAFAIYVVFAILSVIFAFIHAAIGALMSVIGALAVMGFFLARDMIFSGNSVGKKMMKIKTVTAGGEPLTFTHSAKRNFVFAVPYLFIFIQNLLGFVGAIFPTVTCLTGIVWIILVIIQVIIALAVLGFIIWEIITITKEPEGVRWGDQFAGTRVVAEAPSATAQPATPPSPPQPPPSAPQPPPGPQNPPPPPAQG